MKDNIQIFSMFTILMLILSLQDIISMDSTLTTLQTKEKIKLYFESIYENIPEASGNSSIKGYLAQSVACRDTGGSFLYGEMLYDSIQDVLMNDFQATSEDIFMDLGSGSGKAPIEFTLLTDGGKSIGLEFVPFRHELALKAHENLTLNFQSKVEFIQADMFTYPIPSATIYMIDALAMHKQFSKIAEFLITYGPTKFRVWSIGIHRLPFPEKFVKKFRSKYFDATWIKGQSTTLYWIEKD